MNREGESSPERGGLSFTQGRRESCAHLLSPRSWCLSSYSRKTASSCSADRPPAPGSKKNSLRLAWDLLWFSHQLTVSDFKKCSPSGNRTPVSRVMAGCWVVRSFHTAYPTVDSPLCRIISIPQEAATGLLSTHLSVPVRHEILHFVLLWAELQIIKPLSCSVELTSPL